MKNLDPMARGGVRRYLDTVTPIEYKPDIGEVNLLDVSFTGLCDLYGSDKGTIKHRYTEVYERILDELVASRRLPRQQCPLSVAEVGIACGASLRALANYLPAATVVGYDIRSECATLCADLRNVKVVIGDPQLMAPPEKLFDIFIDDASHISEQIVRTFENCWDWIAPGGFYVIEDLRCTYNPGYTEQFRQHFDPMAVNDRQRILEMMDIIMRLVDARNSVCEFRYHPQMLVIRKFSEA
jgi:hypothetical protein